MTPRTARVVGTGGFGPPVRPVYVIEGPERYLKTQAVENVRRAVLGEDADPVACSVFSASAGLAEVFDELRTLPLLGGRRLIILEDADVFIREHRQAVERYCEQPSSSASLLMVCKSLGVNTKLYKIVQKGGLLISCEPPKGDAMAPWIARQSQAKYGKRMDPRTASLLRRLAGDDLATLDNELAKLAIYVGDRPAITVGDVDNLVGCHREEKVFGITEALARRDAPAALALWEQAWLTERTAPARAVGGLAWGLRRNLEGKAFVDQGGSYQELYPKFWKRSDEIKALLDGMSLAGFESQLRELARAERSVLSGMSRSLQVAVEKMIVSLCTVRRT